MNQITMFMWGYWGWGSVADKFVESVDALEASRGFKPPLFVDIRLSRSVRAKLFNGKAFEQLVGSSRYVCSRHIDHRIAPSDERPVKTR